jgi:hypothetical protein
MPVVARHVVAGPGHQLVRLAGIATRTSGELVAEHKFLEFFLAGRALVFIDRHMVS